MCAVDVTKVLSEITPLGKVLVVNGEDGQEDIFANLGWEEVEWLLSTSLTPETTMVDIGSSVVSVVGIF